MGAHGAVCGPPEESDAAKRATAGLLVPEGVQIQVIAVYTLDQISPGIAIARIAFALQVTPKDDGIAILNRLKVKTTN
jgi:hypothetical protein